MIVDIRFNDASRVSQWRGTALQQALGSAYEWLPALGNRNYKGGEIEIANWEIGRLRLDTLLALTPVVLLCACADPWACHRSVVARRYAQARPGTEFCHLAHGEAWDAEEERVRYGWAREKVGTCPTCACPLDRGAFVRYGGRVYHMHCWNRHDLWEEAP